jgi:hypothetical protein
VLRAGSASATRKQPTSTFSHSGGALAPHMAVAARTGKVSINLVWTL